MDVEVLLEKHGNGAKLSGKTVVPNYFDRGTKNSKFTCYGDLLLKNAQINQTTENLEPTLTGFMTQF